MRDTLSISRVLLLHPAIRQEVMDTITRLENKVFPITVKVGVVQSLHKVDEQNAAADVQKITDALNVISSARAPLRVAFTPDDCKTLPKTNDGTVPFVQKALDYKPPRLFTMFFTNHDSKTVQPITLSKLKKKLGMG